MIQRLRKGCLLGLLSLVVVACQAPLRLRADVPEPLGPTRVEMAFVGSLLPIADQQQSRLIHGKVFEIHRDANGDDWLRDPQPPHQAVRVDSLVPPSAIDADLVSALNLRITSRPALWNFARHSESYAMAATGLNRVRPQLGVQQTCAGASVVHYDNQTLHTHVVYPMRTDVGVPDLAGHPALRYDVQMVGNFMSVAIEGSLPDVARFLAEQGIRVIRGVKVPYGGATHEVDTYIDQPSRTIAFFVGANLLRAITF